MIRKLKIAHFCQRRTLGEPGFLGAFRYEPSRTPARSPALVNALSVNRVLDFRGTLPSDRNHRACNAAGLSFSRVGCEDKVLVALSGLPVVLTAIAIYSSTQIRVE